MASDSDREMMNSRKVSRFLSLHLEYMHAIGSDNAVKCRRLMGYLSLIRMGMPGVTKFIGSGSRSEGLCLAGSDQDTMMVLDEVIVVQPNDALSARNVSKTILVMDKTNCRPGFTLLRLHQFGVVDNFSVLNAITYFNGSRYLSSVAHCRNMQLPGSYLHGPCASFDLGGIEADYAMCFRCRSWPYDLSDFSKRTKYSVWPPRYLVDDIVKYGCHVVAIGDKHSDLFAMQWRISFARGEKVLVWSFNHVQLKMYALLKIFLQDCIERHQWIEGLLCSYFMKTIVFHAIEHSSPSLWTDENCVQCFWYCFTILLETVQTGYLPNYFVPAHNMFLSNVTGDNRIRLLRVLSRYQSMGYTCVFECPSIQPLQRALKESRSSYPIPLGDLRLREYYEDADVWINLQLCRHQGIETVPPINIINKMFLNCANENLLDIFVLYLFQSITFVSIKSLADQTRTKRNYNKTAYRQIRRHKRLLHLSSATDVCFGLLSVATFYYNAGSYDKASDVAIHVIRACQQRAILYSNYPNEEYREEMCGKGYTLLQKAKRSFVSSYAVDAERYNLYPQELEVEVRMSEGTYLIPPLPYALFLLTLSSFRLGDIDQSQTILDDLMAVRTDHIYGVDYPIIHNLSGICHQLLGNTRQAIRAFEEASIHPPNRPAAVRRLRDLCMTLRQQRGTTVINTLDYCNVPHQNQCGDDIGEDMSNDYYKTLYNKDPSKLIGMSWC